MATTRQKEAARRNIKKARAVQSARARGQRIPRQTEGLSTAEDVTDTERDQAWKRIMRAAKKYKIEVEVDDWRDLFKGGKARKR